MISNLLKRASFILVMSFLLISCGKDEMTLEEIYDTFMENRNDLLSAGFVGPIKKITSTTFDNDSRIENGILTEGTIYGTVVSTYNEKGFITSQERFYRVISNIYLRESITIESRDKKNRMTKAIIKSTQGPLDASPTYEEYYEQLFLYDDINGKATVISVDAVTKDTSSSRAEYLLDRYGRIDNNNFRYISLLKNYEEYESLETKKVQNYDDWGNVISKYQHVYYYENPEHFMLYNYVKFEYEYYEK